jgi:hypothetical protein
MPATLLALAVAILVARLVGSVVARARRPARNRIDERKVAEALREGRAEVETFRDLERRYYLSPDEGEPTWEESQATSVFAEAGFPTFEHNQYTIEGEIERFGAFGMAGARATGWKRGVALLLVVSFFAPFVIGLGVIVARAL